MFDRDSLRNDKLNENELKELNELKEKIDNVIKEAENAYLIEKESSDDLSDSWVVVEDDKSYLPPLSASIEKSSETKNGRMLNIFMCGTCAHQFLHKNYVHLKILSEKTTQDELKNFLKSDYDTVFLKKDGNDVVAYWAQSETKFADKKIDINLFKEDQRDKLNSILNAQKNKKEDEFIDEILSQCGLNLFFSGENIAHLHEQVEGEKFIVNGPGSGMEIFDQANMMIPYVPYSTTMGIAKGAGLFERMDNVMHVLRNDPPNRKDLKPDSEELKKLNDTYLKMREENSKNPITTVNLFGWSRGGAACITLANRIHKEFNDKIQINMFLLDPVPGIFLANADNTSIPPNVKNVQIIYAVDERSAFFSPVFPAYNRKETNLHMHFLPGGHIHSAGGFLDHQGKAVPGDHDLKTVGILTRYYMQQFALKVGIKLKDNDQLLRFTIDDLTKFYDDMLKNRDKYKESAISTPYIFSQIFGFDYARKAIPNSWFNYYLKDLKEDQGFQHDEKFVDHVHQLMVKVSREAKKIVTGLKAHLADEFREKKIVDANEMINNILNHSLKSSKDDLLKDNELRQQIFYRALSEELIEQFAGKNEKQKLINNMAMRANHINEFKILLDGSLGELIKSVVNHNNQEIERERQIEDFQIQKTKYEESIKAFNYVTKKLNQEINHLNLTTAKPEELIKLHKNIKSSQKTYLDSIKPHYEFLLEKKEILLASTSADFFVADHIQVNITSLNKKLVAEQKRVFDMTRHLKQITAAVNKANEGLLKFQNRFNKAMGNQISPMNAVIEARNNLYQEFDLLNYHYQKDLSEYQKKYNAFLGGDNFSHKDFLTNLSQQEKILNDKKNNLIKKYNAIAELDEEIDSHKIEFIQLQDEFILNKNEEDAANTLLNNEIKKLREDPVFDQAIDEIEAFLQNIKAIAALPLFKKIIMQSESELDLMVDELKELKKFKELKVKEPIVQRKLPSLIAREPLLFKDDNDYKKTLFFEPVSKLDSLEKAHLNKKTQAASSSISLTPEVEQPKNKKRKSEVKLKNERANPKKLEKKLEKPESKDNIAKKSITSQQNKKKFSSEPLVNQKSKSSVPSHTSDEIANNKAIKKSKASTKSKLVADIKVKPSQVSGESIKFSPVEQEVITAEKIKRDREKLKVMEDLFAQQIINIQIYNKGKGEAIWVRFATELTYYINDLKLNGDRVKDVSKIIEEKKAGLSRLMKKSFFKDSNLQKQINVLDSMIELTKQLAHNENSDILYLLAKIYQKRAEYIDKKRTNHIHKFDNLIRDVQSVIKDNKNYPNEQMKINKAVALLERSIMNNRDAFYQNRFSHSEYDAIDNFSTFIQKINKTQNKEFFYPRLLIGVYKDIRAKNQSLILADSVKRMTDIEPKQLPLQEEKTQKRNKI